LLEQQLLKERQARNRTPTYSNEEDLRAGPSARYGNIGKARAAVVKDEEEEDDRNLKAHPTIKGGLGNQHSRTQRL
jgi:hypothetical protein